MSNVYYSVASTFGAPLIQAQNDAASPWSTPQKLANLIQYLTSLDFADYSARRRALFTLTALRVPPFFYTYPFDPFTYPLIPPHPQTRFPAAGFFILLRHSAYIGALSSLSAALSYRDSDGPIGPSQLAFTTALVALSTASGARENFFDRASYELDRVLVWAPYPPPPLSPC